MEDQSLTCKGSENFSSWLSSIASQVRTALIPGVTKYLMLPLRFYENGVVLKQSLLSLSF